jgi:glycosyltransferase involved in cell wall biosynthesis
MKVALVYDRLNKWGGAERVLLALHRLFPDAPLYASVCDKEKASWVSVFDVRTSFLQSFPFAMHHELYAPLMPLAFESFNFDKFDLVISVTSEAAKGIITKPQTKHICYCLTPTRYLWSGYSEYFKNFVFKIISKPIVWYLRFWDKIAANRPDKFIAISKEVQVRIKKYYGRQSSVVYPPLSFMTNGVSHMEKEKSISGKPFVNYYFLIVSRLVPYKKIDLAIKVFNKLKLSLKIIGIGTEMEKLKAMSGRTIEFLGNLTDKDLVEYYSECQALIFPGLEDFGLAIIEAQSFGKPVIAFKKGGALETIIGGKTGIFFDKQTVESLEKAITQFNGIRFDPKDCVIQAEKFSFEKFKKEFTEEISK